MQNNEKSVLIVEDEAILYDIIQTTLEEQGYKTYDYCPSVAQALLFITDEKPDLVLLDINLKGEETGIDLGERLSSKLNIPYMYITELEDDETFRNVLNTKPDLVHIKSKPVLNEKELIRNINLIFSKQEPNEKVITQEGVFVYPDYPIKMEEKELDKAFRKLILFKNIVCVEIDYDKDKGSGQRNWLRINTLNQEEYYLKSSLVQLAQNLPEQFVQISERQIINISSEMIDSKVNGSLIITQNSNSFVVKPTYKEKVEKALAKHFL